MKKYFVFDYYNKKEHSLWVVCCLEKRLLKEVDIFKLLDPEKLSIRGRQEKAVKFLQQKKIKDVWSYRGRNAFNDWLFGFQLHHSEGENKSFFHYDFIDPKLYGETFKSKGIELREFRRQNQESLSKPTKIWRTF